MKKQTVLIGIVISIIAFGCGSGDNAEKTKKEKTAKSEKKEMTIEVYAKIVNEQRALLMEKYWPKFQENTKEENKKLYEKYTTEKKDILEKYGFERDFVLSRYFRRNMKEVMKYQKTNPDYIDYAEFGQAKNAIIDLAMSKAVE